MKSQSSAESEFYAIGSGAYRGTTLRNIVTEAEVAFAEHNESDPNHIELWIGTDSTAAQGILLRHGVGRVRHLATR